MCHAAVIFMLVTLGVNPAENLVRPDAASSTPGDWVRYDDGTAHWFSWDGSKRGVWFDMFDFLPGCSGTRAISCEYWFYHHSSYPWDSSDFYAELWTGPAASPESQLDRFMLTATHYTAVRGDYQPWLFTGRTFWVLMSTELSIGGWPSLMGDGSPPDETHSFYLDQGVWVPWTVAGDEYDFMIAYQAGPLALSSLSWGAIKGLYR